MSIVDDFCPVLARIDAKVFGEKGMICFTDSDLGPLASEGSVIYCPSIAFIRKHFKAFRTATPLPDRNFFLLHRTLFTKEAEQAVQARAEGEVLLPEFYVEVALKRVWRKFQIRRQGLLPQGAFPAPIPVEVVERCSEIEFDRDDYQIVVENERRVQYIERCGRGMPEGPALQRDAQLGAECLAIGTEAKLNYALSEDAAIRFLRRLMMAIEPGAISSNRGTTPGTGNRP
jgi:hypothetical protein